MTTPKHNPVPSTMRLFVLFGTKTVALMLGDPDDTDQPRKRIIVLPREQAAREDDPNVRLLRDMVRRQDAHDDLVEALQPFLKAADNYADCDDSKFVDNDAVITVGDLRDARAAVAKAQPQKPADAR